MPRCSAGCCNIRAHRARCATCARRSHRCARKGALADCRRRSAGADAARLARRTRRRYRDRIGAALWRADGLWRAARRLYGGARCAKARAARAHRRPVGRFARAAGLPAGAADPRAAYPPRKGDLQHLHRAGAAGRDRLDVCGLSRPGGADRRSRAQVHRRTAVLAAGLRRLGFAPRIETLLRYGDGGGRRQARARSSPARGREASTCGSASGTLGIALDETTTPEIVEAVWRAFGGELAYAEVEAGAREALPAELKRASRFPDPSGVPRPPLRDRAAALHAQARRPRPRARPRDDPARLLHHEAQRDHRDDPADLAGVRRTASVRAARTGRRAITRCSRGWSNGCATSPAMTRSRCSRIPARRANMPACSRSAAITPRAARRTARSA